MLRDACKSYIFLFVLFSFYSACFYFCTRRCKLWRLAQASFVAITTKRNLRLFRIGLPGAIFIF